MKVDPWTTKTASNPSPRTPTSAMLRARDEFGSAPSTEREHKLFELLCAAYEASQDAEDVVNERLADMEAEADDADSEKIDWDDAPDPIVQLVDLERVIRQRRDKEPPRTPFPEPATFGAPDSYPNFVAQREATDLLEEARDELKAWRSFAKEHQ